MTCESGARPVVSFIIVVRNGARHLPALFDDLLTQDYPHGKTELLVVDGDSTDGTKSVAERFAAAHPGLRVRVLDNPRRILASGWNVALAHATGEIMLRVDAHSRLPADFIRRNVECITSGRDVCGGLCGSRPPSGRWGRLLYMAESSRFGGSAAGFRNPGRARYVDSLAYAAYRRTVFEKVGGYDERLVRNQDNEIHYRMKRAGFRFYYDPAIHSQHMPRETLRGLLKQKFLNGMWIGMMVGIEPRCFGLRHYVPGLFVLGCIAALLLGLAVDEAWAWWPLAAVGALYAAAAVVFTIEAACRAEGVCRLLSAVLPAIFLAMHLGYGLGTLIGLAKMPFFAWRGRRRVVPRPL